jgi:quercetin dioxygenase-like cupin family protein
MRISSAHSVSVLALILLSILRAEAQTQPSPDPGVTPVRLMNRPEVRVTRVELQPGAVRSVHQHDDVRFHLFIPITGKLELTIGSGKPVEALPGQAFFMEKSTPHGFRNVGTTPAAVMEVFVKESGAAAEGTPPERLGSDEALALLQTLAAVSAHRSSRDTTVAFPPSR